MPASSAPFRPAASCLAVRVRVHAHRYCVRLVLFGFIWAIVLPRSTAATPELRFSPVRVTGGEVEFYPEDCDPSVPFPTVTTDQIFVTDTEHYAVAVDLESIHATETGEAIYEFYVRPKLSGAHSFSCGFRVQSISSGTFLDQQASVRLQVGEPSALENVDLSLPLHNSASVALLDSRQDLPYAKVGLSSESPITVKLVNLTDLPIIVSELSVSPSHGLWKSCSGNFGAAGPTELHIDRSAAVEDAIVLHLQPDRWKAFSASVFPLATSKPHETILVTLGYYTKGGFDRTLQILVPVRFVPSFWSLLLAVIIGASLGSAVPMIFYSGHRDLKRWLKALGAACLVAIIAWLLGLVLVSNNSEFRIMGFELDPLQLVPALLAGALIGLCGFRSADAVQKFIQDHFGSSAGGAT